MPNLNSSCVASLTRVPMKADKGNSLNASGPIIDADKARFRNVVAKICETSQVADLIDHDPSVLYLREPNSGSNGASRALEIRSAR